MFMKKLSFGETLEVLKMNRTIRAKNVNTENNNS